MALRPQSTSSETITIGLLGAGNVGAQVAKTLVEERELISARVGTPIKLVGVAVRDPESPRDWRIP
jgi:homoserine dehydrogenase